MKDAGELSNGIMKRAQGTSSSSNLWQHQYWQVDEATLASDCLSLKEWTKDSPVLEPMMNTFSGTTMLNGEDCQCHTVMASLLLHQRGAQRLANHSPLEACQYLQRILDWAWTRLKNREACRGDEMLLFMVTATAKEVVNKYKITIPDIEGSSVPLSLGQEAVHKSVKTIFLCRLVSARLLQLDALLTEAVEAGASCPLRAYVADTQERIIITRGMLPTFD